MNQLIHRHRRLLIAVFSAVWLWAGVASAQNPVRLEKQPASTTQTASDWTLTEDLWYVLEIGGKKTGWLNSRTYTDGRRYRTVSDIQMKMSRGPQPVEIAMTYTTIETAAGKPVSLESVQKFAQGTMRVAYEVVGDHFVQTSVQSGREIKKDVPIPPGEWLMPQAAERSAQQQRTAGAQTIIVRALTPELGIQPVTLTSMRTGAGELEHEGRNVPVTIWETTMDIMPGMKSTQKFADDGTLMVEDALTNVGAITTRLTTKEQAQGKIAEDELPELLTKTFVTPDKPIKNPAKAVKAKLRIKTREGQLPALPAAGAQRVEPAEYGRSAILSIDINDNLPASDAEVSDREYLEPSSLIESGDPLVNKLLAGAAEQPDEDQKDTTDALSRGEALRRLVRKHISKKGMETAFASAAETAQNRTGDCSEHAVLLCALFRADSTPARVATGLVYADAFAGHEGIFGWHMWTQALIDGKWVDFDATLPRRYNAVHVLTTTSSLSDGTGLFDLVSVLQLMGNMEIEVLEVEYE